MATTEEADWVAPRPITIRTTARTSSAVAVRLFILSRSARLRAAARTFAIDVTFAVIRTLPPLPSIEPGQQICLLVLRRRRTDRSLRSRVRGAQCPRAPPVPPPARRRAPGCLRRGPAPPRPTPDQTRPRLCRAGSAHLARGR